MKALYWKEWRENRLIVLLAGLLLFVLMSGCIAWYRSNPSQMLMQKVDAQSMEGLLYMTWALCALLCGSSMVAPEIGQGTLQFLSSLPIARAKIWTTKALMSTLILTLSIACSLLIYAIFYEAAYRRGVLERTTAYSMADIAGNIPYLLATILSMLAIGSVLTMLVDRTITALIGSLILFVALYALLGVVVTYLFAPQNLFIAMVVAGLLLVPTLLSVSYQTFVRGETLRTSARFRVAAPHMLQSILIIAIALTVSFLWIRSW